jgi:hypothetical protein
VSSSDRNTATGNAGRTPRANGPDYVDLAEERHGVVEYPLRKPEEDERWAVNTVRLWMVILSGLMTFITVMLVLGAIYD